MRVPPWLLFLIAFLGVMCLVWGVYNAVDVLSYRHWSTASGMITKFDVDGPQHYEDGIRYNVHLEYAYSVAGDRYVSSRITPGDDGSFLDEAHCQLLTRKYPRGRAVTVSYNPEAPDQSVLNSQDFSGPAEKFGMGMVCLFFVGFAWAITNVFPEKRSNADST